MLVVSDVWISAEYNVAVSDLPIDNIIRRQGEPSSSAGLMLPGNTTAVPTANEWLATKYDGMSASTQRM